MLDLCNPYLQDGQWLRGNTHTHTTRSDGHNDPQDVVDFYASHGYDFLALTDHNLALEIASLDSKGMTLIRGEELTCEVSHVIGLGLGGTLPKGDSLQNQVDLVCADGGIAVVAHPHWMGLVVEKLESLHGHTAIELSNQVCHRINGRGDSVAWWDALLSTGHRCWGVAVDDCHDLQQDACNGWILVKATGRTWEAIRGALVRGSFIATNGPSVSRIETEGRTVRVITSECEEIRFIGRGPCTLHAVEASMGGPVTEARYTLGRDQDYVRVEVRDETGRRAWSQPLWTAQEQ